VEIRFQGDVGSFTRWFPEAERNVQYLANNIRRERTGVHATITIAEDTTVLSYDTFNVERHTDRIRLANAAHKMLTPIIQEAYLKEHLAHDLDLFCRAVWPSYLETLQPEPIEGISEPSASALTLDPYILEGGGTILFAPPGMGKSYTAMLMAVSVDAGVNDLWPVNQMPVMFVNLERSGRSMQRRLASVNIALGLDPARPLLMVNQRGRSLTDLRELLVRSVQKWEVGLVVVDSISRAGVGDLTENRPVNAIIDTLNGLCPTWLALAHTPRDNANHVYGSIHFDAGADVVVQLTSERKEMSLGISLNVTKANDIAFPPTNMIAYDFDSFGLCGVRAPKRSEFLQLAAANASLGDEVVDYLLVVSLATGTDIALALDKDRSTVSRLLSSDGRFRVQEKRGRDVLYGLHTSLQVGRDS